MQEVGGQGRCEAGTDCIPGAAAPSRPLHPVRVWNPWFIVYSGVAEGSAYRRARPQTGGLEAGHDQ